MHYKLNHLVYEFYRFTIYLSLLDDTDVFRVKKSYHSKKIVKQLKKEYKDDLEKTTTTIPEQSTRIGTKHLSFFLSFFNLFIISCISIKQNQGTVFCL